MAIKSQKSDTAPMMEARPSDIVQDTDVVVMRYSKQAIMPDLIRAVAGIVLCGGISLVPGVIELLRWIGLGLSILFIVYLVRTILRMKIRIHVSEYGMRLTGMTDGTAFAWPELAGFRLRYFSTRRDGKKGWFELTLTAPGSKIVTESTLDGFDKLLSLARDAAQDNGLMVDDITRTNLMRMDEAETLVRAASRAAR
ncbi:hypothetical protein [Thalassospira sp.]|uniref:hypothetical protein n=1 Tax=Thalassospira sp. TaxID=1912094 RepID=UPI002734B0AA|nr:hypothetical protein [Thalassospira sp.]MDP2698104.1 hypothetical protein [Thalassospira sp.]